MQGVSIITPEFATEKTGLADILALTLQQCQSRSQGDKPMIFAGMHTSSQGTRLPAAFLGWLVLLGLPPVMAQTEYTRIPTQYIAALGEPGATSGTGAEAWGLWSLDPGPRGVRLSNYGKLKAAGGVAPAQWTFDDSDWWLEENGLIMEPPSFPVPAGRYVVTGDREVTAVLTIHPKDASGVVRWDLDKGASLYDVTHLKCRSARYTPAAAENSCSPEKASQDNFPVTPGAAMPPVENCNKQDYEVLIVVGMVNDN
jgi:hypothetical protein